MEMEPPAIRRGGTEDLISGLPDELLHTILVRLLSAAAAARTSVLSRRWRRVWAHMPEFVLCDSPAPAAPPPPSSLLDSIDAALNSYAATTLNSLKIQVSQVDRCDVPAHRISRWLRFASQRIAGELRLNLDLKEDARTRGDIEELALPICERATMIRLRFRTDFFLRPPPAGSFSALTILLILCGQMDGGELGRVVSSVQCPCLRQLCVFVKLGPTRDISISSESLEWLYYHAAETGKLEVHAPMLKHIVVSRTGVAEACIVAPKLETVEWTHDPYDPGRHQVVVAGRHLRSLHIMHSAWLGILTSSTRLMKRFDTVSELTVALRLHEGIEGYVTFLNEMDKLPNHRLDGITFDSLEEIGIALFTGSAEEVKFVELLLSRCNTVTTLKRVDFTLPIVPVSSEIMAVVQRISSTCHQNSKVQFHVHTMEVRKP